MLALVKVRHDAICGQVSDLGLAQILKDAVLSEGEKSAEEVMGGSDA